MKRRTILTLSCLVTGLSAGTASAQSRPESLDSITVTATRVPVALHNTARIVTLLDSMTIASAPAETVNDLLKYALGVDVRQRGAMGMQTDISIRGGTYNHQMGLTSLPDEDLHGRAGRALADDVVGRQDHFVAPVLDRKNTRLNSSHTDSSRMPSSA